MDKTMTRDGIKVRPGQIWRDLDKRMNGRLVEVVRVDSDNGRAHYVRADVGELDGRSKPKAGSIAIKRMHRHATDFDRVPNLRRADSGLRIEIQRRHLR